MKKMNPSFMDLIHKIWNEIGKNKKYIVKYKAITILREKMS